MSEYDPAALEQRWRERWAEEGRYEAEPGDGDEDATFVTVPYPYPSGGMHIGHARTYTVPDAYARYRRQQGDNVLFPMAWHVTGTPIIGAVERLKKGESEQLSVLRDTYDVPEDTLQDLETPMGFARYFIENHYKQGMQSLGLSIDWRREFTTNDERYSQFITWQYETLKNRGLLEKGLHPVKYCTNEQQPVTTHDLLEGEEAEFQEYTLIRFGWNGDSETAGSDEESIVVPMATLRPETVRGVTNAFIDPDAEYALADVDGEHWLLSVAAVEKLRLQDREVEIREESSGERLVGEHVENPITGEDVLVLPADFVDADNATGVVMSVPAHSPDDYVALQEASDDAERMEQYGIDIADVRTIEPRPIIEVEGYGEVPARDAVEDAGIESTDDPQLETVTKELYNREFHAGHLTDAYEEFAGEVVEDVRERFREYYGDAGAFDAMQEFSAEVVCRCGGDVEVAKQDTWFLRYDDETWKRKAKNAVSQMDAIPENTRGEYTHTIDWLNEWPCIRNYGLGTRLPWDEEFVIEPLSDSTVYMAYYTIAHRLKEIPVADLNGDFFDALFYGADAVPEPDERALQLREEWTHWYPVDYRFSANDLISNHLTFFLFHHAELFDDIDWPQGIVVMGMGLLEGKKMSSSKGHVVLPGTAIEDYGADTVRFFLLNSSEPWQDYDWRDDLVESVSEQLQRFWRRARDVIESSSGEPDLEPIDRWLLSKLQGTIREVTEAMDGAETRTATQAAFYGLEEHLRWYRRRTDLDRPGARWTRQHVLRTRLRLLAPFVPFMTNELHENLTGVPVEDEPWPEVEPDREDPVVELKEQQVERATDDIRGIQESLRNAEEDVPEADPDVIRIVVAADWKRDVFEAVADIGPEVGAVMNEVMQDPSLRERGDAVNALVQELVELARDHDQEELAMLASLDEQDAYESATDFLSEEFNADIDVRSEEAATDDAGSNAVPLRPGIELAVRE
jgi:leucyl-tRNA synthetase